MIDATAPMVCTVHPKEETSLRCNKCGRPMCTKCANPTPVGYRCTECVKGQRKVFFNAKPTDPILQFGLAFGLSVLATAVLAIVPRVGFFFFWFIAFAISSAIGGGIANLAYQVVGKRRSEYAYLVVATGIVLGALAVTGMGYLLFLPRPDFITLGIYIFAACSGAIGYLRFGR